MSESVETIQERVAQLNAAIATGARSVTLGGQTIIYNTTESLIKARNDALAQLNQASGATARKRRYIQVVHNGRGYD